jgi:signal transduction histidine kinase
MAHHVAEVTPIQTTASPTEQVPARGLPSDETQSELLGALAHEVRNALATIQVSLELLDDGEVWTTGEARTLFEQIKRTTAWMVGLVDNTQWAANSDDPSMLKLVPLSLSDAIQTAISVTAPLLYHRGQEVRVRPPDLVLSVYGDNARLAQVLVNFLINASSYGYIGDTIEINTDVHNGRARVRVTDHGPGIPFEEQQRIFERYSRGSAGTNGRVRGMGLGLYLAKNFVEAHGGRIGVESIPGHGATFWFELPCIEEQASGEWPAPRV